MAGKLRVAVVGAGKMGRLHSRIYSEMENVELVGIADKQIDKAKQLCSQYGGHAYANAGQLLGQVDAVTVAVPTEHHLQAAAPFLEHSVGVLVEKPLAITLPEARKLLDLSRGNNCVLQVGYSERFNPVVQAMKRLDFTPRFIEAQRISPFTFRSTDVGVVLDMMIHDIDIVLSLAGSQVKDIQAAGVNVLGSHEDIANVRLTFESGCVANLTASRLALKTERKVRVFSEQAYLSLDYLKKTGTVISKTGNIDMVNWLKEHQETDGSFDVQDVDWTELVKVEQLDIDNREPLRLEQEAFIKAVANGSTPEVSADDAIAAMELAEEIIRVMSEHHWQGINN